MQYFDIGRHQDLCKHSDDVFGMAQLLPNSGKCYMYKLSKCVELRL